MTTAHSLSTQRDPQDGDAGAWPVLARIPDVSAAARPAPQRSPRLAAPARSAEYRFDPPQSRGSQASLVRSSADRSDGGSHAAHSPQPPAHHLNQRAARTTPPYRRAPSESPILPAWDPFTIPGSRFPDSFAPILSFLVLVALFTAAGTSVLMLRSSNRQPVSESPAAAHVEQSVAGPTAVGPLGATASRLEPAPSTEPTAAANRSASSPALTPLTDDDATNNDVTGVETTPPAAATPADHDYPTTEYPAPVFPETGEIQLPQAQMNDTPPAVARFSGEIREASPRQAQHDNQSSIH